MKHSIYVKYVKPALDFIISFIGLLILSPFLLIFALIVKIDSRGPVFFRQARCGANGKEFMIFKFRTMYVDAPKNTPTAMLENPEIYITRCGRWMRKLSIDELPQILNILKGEMSLVGPRPLVPNEVWMHEDRRQHGADWLKPGLTGWAQINGRDKLNDKMKGKLDGVYAKNISFWTDVKILFLTVPYVLTSQGIREGVPENLGELEGDDYSVPNNISTFRPRADVLLITQFFYPEYVTTSTLITQLAEDLVKESITVDVLCGYPFEYLNETKRLPQKDIHAGIKIHRIRYIRADRRGKISRLINYFSFVTSVFLHAGMIRKYRCVFTFSNPALLPVVPNTVCRKKHQRTVTVFHDIYPQIAIQMGAVGENSLISKVMYHVNRRSGRKSTGIVTVCPDMKQTLIDSQFGREEQIKVLPNWFDPETLIHVEEVTEPDFIEYRKKFQMIALYGGNMGTCQDMETILSAAQLCAEDGNIAFLLVGHGNKIPALKQKVEELGLQNIFFYDFLHGETYAQILKISDCCLASLEKGIGTLAEPSKIYAYLAAAKPVLYIVDGEVSLKEEFDRTGAGFCFEQGQAEALAEKLRFLRDNKDICREMGLSAKDLFDKKYTRKKVTAQYAAYIRSLLAMES